MSIAAHPDHVAVAVHDMDAAAKRWRDELGGGWLIPRHSEEAAPFATRQLRYPGGAKLELLEPTRPGFATAFLDRFGPRIHHITLKVGSLLPAVDALRDADFDVVDVFTGDDEWHEAFLRPSQIGGVIVQIAWAPYDDAGWIERLQYEPESPAPHATRLLGPTLTHPDLGLATDVWSTLGATVDRDGDVLQVTWGDHPLGVRIETGPSAGPVGLRFEDGPELPADDVAGPATLRG